MFEFEHVPLLSSQEVHDGALYLALQQSWWGRFMNSVGSHAGARGFTRSSP